MLETIFSIPIEGQPMVIFARKRWELALDDQPQPGERRWRSDPPHYWTFSDSAICGSFKPHGRRTT